MRQSLFAKKNIKLQEFIPFYVYSQRLVLILLITSLDVDFKLQNFEPRQRREI